MKTVRRNITYNVHSPYNQPQISVEPGEEFLAETELCTGGWLHSAEDKWTPEKSCAVNPTVCVAIKGARPGDMLAVEILDITLDNLGYTGFDSALNPLANKIHFCDWGINVNTVRIDDDCIHWSDKLKLPVRPMIGTLGTAPREETLSNAKAGPHGGNMDVQEVCIGSTVYLPIEVEGALLHIGDVHALQGDGEINGSGGIECRSIVKLRVQLMKRPEQFHCVRIENEDYIMTVGCERSLEESIYKASAQLLQWMVEEYYFTVHEAYLLMGQVMEARSTQFVNPTYSYICKIAKQYLIPKVGR